MELVRSRAGDRVHRCATGTALAGFLRACRHAELLQSIRKRQRVVGVVEPVVVDRSIQQVLHTKDLVAGHRDPDTRVHRSAGAESLVHRSRARQNQQAGHVAGCQGQLDNTFVLDDVGDGHRAGFHRHFVLGHNFDRLGHLTHLQRRVDDNVATDLQYDACLYKCLESRQGHFQLEARRLQGRERIRSRLVGYGATYGARISLRQRDIHSRQYRASLVCHDAADLPCLAKRYSAGQSADRYHHHEFLQRILLTHISNDGRQVTSAASVFRAHRTRWRS